MITLCLNSNKYVVKYELFSSILYQNDNYGGFDHCDEAPISFKKNSNKKFTLLA